MRLRQKSKRDQAVDAVASVAKTWSEWHLGERVHKKATKSARKASSLKGSAKVPSVKGRKGPLKALKSTPVKVAGAIAVLGGVGAAVAKKLRGGHAEPPYTPPGPAPDMTAPPPSPVVVEDLDSGTTSEAKTEAAPSAGDEPIAVDPGEVEVGDLGGADDAGGADEAQAGEADAGADAEAGAEADAQDGAGAEAEEAEKKS